MDRSLFVFIFSILFLILQLVSLYFKLKQGKQVFYLVSLCSIFFGGVCYFLYGFPLDEGIIADADIPVFERNFVASSALALSGVFSLVVDFSWKKRS